MNKRDFTFIKPNIWKHNTEQKYAVDLYLGRAAEGKQQITCLCYLFAVHQRKGKTVFIDINVTLPFWVSR